MSMKNVFLCYMAINQVRVRWIINQKHRLVGFAVLRCISGDSVGDCYIAPTVVIMFH